MKLDVRNQVSTFLLQWLTGSPTVSVELSTKIVTYMDCGECMSLFMGRWAKYSIQSEDNNSFKASLAGTEMAIEFYKNNKKDLGKIRTLKSESNIRTAMNLKVSSVQIWNRLENYRASNLKLTILHCQTRNQKK